MLVDAADWIADQYQQLQAWARDRFDDDPRHAEIAKNAINVACAVVVAAAVIVTAWMVISVLGALTVGTAQLAATGLGWALERVADWQLTEIVTKPVHDYITAHAAGLPAAAEGIWSAWALTGPVLWLLCWLARSWGARLAWVLYGVGTVAMVYSASPATGQLLAAGVAVLYWAVLSILAFRGVGRRPTVHVHQPTAPETTTTLEQLRQQVDERLGEIRTRLERIEADGDELAARRSGSERS
ncbi:hypothetical protein [Streptosporangium sp. NPDC051022]|uniref:hypothetical protein n=1 Tax=Streptosporangium sp. NPDC051022 TaxID=3155752 RepID=UPI0034362AA2